MTRRRVTLVLAAMLLILPPAGKALGDAGGEREFQLKAAFIYNFAQFVEWPREAFDGPDAPFVIGVMGDDAFGVVVEQTMRGKAAGGRPIVVRRFSGLSAMPRCQLLFVAASERDRMPQIVERCARDNILTVGDFDGFTGASGMIRFLIEDNRLRFEVNVDAVNGGHLKVSSKLLKLARIYNR